MKILSNALAVLRFLLARTWIGVLVVLSVAAGWLLEAGLAPARTASAPSMEEHAGHEPEAAAKELWTCAMHPQIRLPDPGKCPLCSMDLVPVRADEDFESMRRLTVRPAARALMKVQTSPVERRSVEAEVRMAGKIEYDETRLAHITAWVGGRIDRLYVDYTGVEVKKGDHMVYLYSPKLYTDQTALLEALKRVNILEGGGADRQEETAYKTLDASRERLRQLGLTAAQIEEIEERGTASDHLTIHAPTGGVVVDRVGQLGMYVQEGTRIYTIADLSHLWVQLDAYESDLAWLRYGQSVEFTTAAHPGDVFTGTIAFLSPELDERTRTVKVRVNLDNPEGKLKPGMFVSAVVRTKVASGGRVMDPDLAGKWICPMHPEVVRDESGACDVCGMDLVTTESRGYVALREDAQMPLVIPATAPLITGTRAVVYVGVPDTDETGYEGREIVLGPRAGDWYLVRNGLREGERVVTRGNFKIDSELQIQARPSMMTPEGGGGGGHHHGGGETPAGPEKQAAGALEAPATQRRALADVEDAWLVLSAARGEGGVDEVRAAYSDLGDAVAAVDREAFQGMSRAMWTELSMLLSNDAVEGGSIDRIEEADRILALTARNIARLRSTFGTSSPDEVERLEVPAAFRERLAALWTAYEELHAALAGDDATAATDALAHLRRARDGVDTAGLGTGAAHREWMARDAAIAASLERLEAAAGLEALREGFEPLSGELARVARSFGLAGVDVYEVECPMALGRGARWLQGDEEVRNPYLGTEMLGCGDVVDRIAAWEDDDE